MKKRYYVAYGSNLNIRQMRHRCPTARMIGTAEIKDYELLFKKSITGSYLTIEPKQGSSVPVGVWEISKYDEKSLDRYEGSPQVYYKKEMRLEIKGIITGKIRVRDVFTYIMHEEREIGMPTLRYVRTCFDGYFDFGFDRKFLRDAIRESEARLYETEI